MQVVRPLTACPAAKGLAGVVVPSPAQWQRTARAINMAGCNADRPDRLRGERGTAGAGETSS